jgi:hypothetical protein
MARHGFSYRKGDNTPASQFVPTGKFGRMFSELYPLVPTEQSLKDLGDAMLDENPNSQEGDNEQVPAGFTYLGQFIDHDITFDPSSLSEKRVDPLALTNFRTPALDLDSVYGAGPTDQPYLYEFTTTNPDPAAGGRSSILQDKFLLGDTTESGTGREGETIPVKENDLPRAPKTSQALIGDPRNDENLIVAQMHLAFLKFHNKIVDGLRDGSIPRETAIQRSIFEEARHLVIWHYQWIVLHDFLRAILDTNQLDQVLNQGRKFYNFKEHAFIPVEFSVAAYRLGHSMIRSEYDYNRVFTFEDPNNDSRITDATLELLFEFTAKSGTASTDFPGLNPTLPSNWIIDWRRFFRIDPTLKPGFSRKLDPFLVDPLASLPNVPMPNSLAVRNLLRGRSVELPSGQSVARFMQLKPLTPTQLTTNPDGSITKDLEVVKKYGFDKETPLWYYILKEAQVQGQGKRLGEVGSRIVAEVFVGLLEGDNSSFLVRDRNWKPTLPAEVPGTFTMVDLLKFVGDINPIGD